jgi:hypothetical protein
VSFEDAADLAGFFDPADFAVAAFYSVLNDAQNLPVRIILDWPGDSVGSLAEAGASSDQLTALIRRADVPYAPARGDVISYGGQLYTVEEARPEGTQAIYRLVLSETF